MGDVRLPVDERALGRQFAAMERRIAELERRTSRPGPRVSVPIQFVGPMTSIGPRSFQAYGGHVWAFSFASGWLTTLGGGNAAVDVKLDGVVAGFGPRFYFNQQNVHAVLNPGWHDFGTLTPGTHTVEMVSPTAGFVTDANDRFRVFVLELPGG